MTKDFYEVYKYLDDLADEQSKLIRGLAENATGFQNEDMAKLYVAIIHTNLLLGHTYKLLFQLLNVEYTGMDAVVGELEKLNDKWR
jgi:hypothetical protein